MARRSDRRRSATLVGQPARLPGCPAKAAPHLVGAPRLVRGQRLTTPHKHTTGQQQAHRSPPGRCAPSRAWRAAARSRRWGQTCRCVPGEEGRALVSAGQGPAPRRGSGACSRCRARPTPAARRRPQTLGPRLPNTARTVSALAQPSTPPSQSLVVGSAEALSWPPGRATLSSERRPLRLGGGGRGAGSIRVTT